MSLAFRNSSRYSLGFLFCAQAVFISVTILSFTFAGLVGSLLTPDPKNATLPVALFSLSTLFLIFPASLLMKKVGRKKGFLVGGFLGILSGIVGVMAIYSNSFILFCISNMLLGGYQAFSQFYRFAAIELSENIHAASAVSITLTGGIVGAIVGPTLGSMINHWMPLYHYAEVYMLTSMLSLLGILFLFFIKTPKPQEEVLPSFKESLRHLTKQQKFIVALINVCIAYFLMVIFMTGTPLSMHHQGFDITHINLVIQWHVLGMYLPSFFIGKILNKFGLSKGYKFACVLFFISLLFIYYGVSFISFSAALILIGVAWNIMYMAGSIIVGTCDSQNKAVIQAVNETCIFFTYSLAAYLSGILVATIQWQGMSLFSIPFIVIALFSVIYYQSSLKLNKSQVSS
jgi:MFS family permease